MHLSRYALLAALSLATLTGCMNRSATLRSDPGLATMSLPDFTIKAVSAVETPSDLVFDESRSFKYWRTYCRNYGPYTSELISENFKAYCKATQGQWTKYNSCEGPKPFTLLLTNGKHFTHGITHIAVNVFEPKFGTKTKIGDEYKNNYIDIDYDVRLGKSRLNIYVQRDLIAESSMRELQDMGLTAPPRTTEMRTQAKACREANEQCRYNCTLKYQFAALVDGGAKEILCFSNCDLNPPSGCPKIGNY